MGLMNGSILPIKLLHDTHCPAPVASTKQGVVVQTVIPTAVVSSVPSRTSLVFSPDSSATQLTVGTAGHDPHTHPQVPFLAPGNGTP